MAVFQAAAHTAEGMQAGTVTAFLELHASPADRRPGGGRHDAGQFVADGLFPNAIQGTRRDRAVPGHAVGNTGQQLRGRPPVTHPLTSKIPIPCVHAQGDAFTIGQTLGRAAAHDIRQRVFATEEFQALQRRWRGTAYLQCLEDAARTAYPHFVREIEGIAAGAGEDFEALFIWNCRGDLRLPDDISPQADLAAASGCTTVMIPAAEGTDGPAVIAHNEDGSSNFMGHCFWFNVTPNDGPAFESFMYPGMLPGHTYGVNQAGLVQTINNVRVHDLKPGIPRHIVSRAVLACTTLDAALDILKRDHRASGFHHNLGQAGSRRVVSVEAPASGCHVREITTPTAHANHLMAEPFRELAQSITESSRGRQARAEEMIAKDALTDGDGPETILFERATPIYRANDEGDDNSQTLSTGVFNLHRDRVEYHIHATPEDRNSLSGTILI